MRHQILVALDALDVDYEKLLDNLYAAYADYEELLDNPKKSFRLDVGAGCPPQLAGIIRSLVSKIVCVERQLSGEIDE